MRMRGGIGYGTINQGNKWDNKYEGKTYIITKVWKEREKKIKEKSELDKREYSKDV